MLWALLAVAAAAAIWIAYVVIRYWGEDGSDGINDHRPFR